MSTRRRRRRAEDAVKEYFDDFEIGITGSGHINITVQYRGQCRKFTTSSTPRCPHSIANLKRDLRRAKTDLDA